MSILMYIMGMGLKKHFICRIGYFVYHFINMVKTFFQGLAMFNKWVNMMVKIIQLMYH